MDAANSAAPPQSSIVSRRRMKLDSPDAVASFGWAWVAAVGALAVHVADEATHDFLSWYNPQALRIRGLMHGIPFPPTFTFWPWLMALGAGVAFLAALTVAAFAGTSWMRPAAYALSAIHALNGTGHLVGAFLAKRAVPGVLSAPLLLAASLWLWHAARELP
ncbi:MAG TPA: hypothetical protein VFS34_01020 [Thermoanaerobaculia bacterium]|nr:hypothetical protein [Thermoanaerobaculia bacterium]